MAASVSSQSFKNFSGAYELMAGLLQVQHNSHERESFNCAPLGFTLWCTTPPQIAGTLSSLPWLQSMHQITSDKFFGVKPCSCSRT